MIEVKKVFDPNYREYKNPSLEGVVPKGLIAYFYPYMDEMDFFLSGMKKVSPLGKKIIEHLRNVLGIESIFFKNDSVFITKGCAFRWEDIEPQVVSILTELINNQSAELFFENKNLVPRCVVKCYSNHRDYNLNRIVYFGKLWNPCFFLNIIEGLESPIAEVTDELLDSPMIKGLLLGLYSISIEKRSEYEWEDVENLLKSALNDLFDFPIEDILLEDEF